jgi:glycosyltransferase involved in cell wall biosynthesis
LPDKHVKRIAIFQYQWPLQIHATNLAEALASEGYYVDFIFKKCRTEFVDLRHLQSVPRVRIINLDNTIDSYLQGKRPLKQLYRLCEVVVSVVSFGLVIFPSVIAAFRHLRKETYSLFIGVEKKGMIWAGILSRLTGVPFVYYSLELYDEQHPRFMGRPDFSALRRMEKRYHRRVAATIIQDRSRGDYLLRANGMMEGEMFFLPVSVRGLSVEHKTNRSFWAEWGIPSALPVVLYLGMIEESRHCLDLARVAKESADKFSTVFHGFGEASFLDAVRSVGGEALTLSTELVPENQLPDVIAAADIGLVLYGSACANDVLTAFSSEKIALFCRAGVPFIAFDSPSYRELVGIFECCVLLTDIEELPKAVQMIIGNYSTYSANARLAFEKYYRFETNVAQVIEQLDRIAVIDSVVPRKRF